MSYLIGICDTGHVIVECFRKGYVVDPDVNGPLLKERAAACNPPRNVIFWFATDTDPRPPDRTFRSAWAQNGQSIGIDMGKARTIHMDRIRRVRDAELRRLDVEYIKADEQGDNPLKRQIAEQKEVLRQLPQTFDLTVYSTPEELKVAWPAELPKEA